MSSSGPSVSRDGLVLKYAYLCRRGARKFLRAGLERGDLEQVATLGLLKAIDRFDAGRETPFEAFAWIAILGELMHHIRDHEHLVRLPRRLGAELPAFRRTDDRLMHELGREASEAEIATALGATTEAVRALRAAARATARGHDPGADRIVRRIAEPQTVGWCERVDLGDALANLPIRERRIVVGAYVLGLSNVELGDRLALSARHVARLRRRALARMQAICALGVPA